MIKKCKIYNFMNMGDSRGNLIVIEGCKDIPFEIKRVFFIFNTNEHVVRGNHANRDSEFVLINVAGSCKVKLTDGFKEQTVCLDEPRKGVYIPKFIWKEMYDFSEDAVLLVLSSEYYNKNEYINSYDEFIKEVKEHF